MATTPTKRELKERAAHYLQRITEIANGATKTAIISFSALGVIWFGQIKPEYQLLNNIYPQLPSFFNDVIQANKVLDDVEKKRHKSEQTLKAKGALPPEQLEQSLEVIKKRDKTVSQSQKELSDQGGQLASLVNTVSFEVFGLKLPVPPLWAALVWNVLLLAVLLYLARARASVWRLCVEALSTLKAMGKSDDSVEDIASGPLWIAPPPSGVAKGRPVTVKDLRAAFGWNRLETLPSIAATAGFLLLGLLQLAVTYQGFSVIKAGSIFTDTLVSRRIVPDALDTKGFNFTSNLAQSSEPQEAEGNAYAVDQKLKQLMIGPVEASLLTLSLSLMPFATLLLVVWWFYPGKVPSAFFETASAPQRLAILVLGLILLVGVFLMIGWVQPSWGIALGESIARALPGVTRFLTASVLSFCVTELLFLAFSRAKTEPVS
jgi:hypothetical protein